MDPVKRETGVNPVRTRHCEQKCGLLRNRFKATVSEPNRFQKIAPIQISAENLHIHWETGKVKQKRLNDQPGDLPFAVQE